MKQVPTEAENPNGFHSRYRVTHADGSPCDENAIYFVLRIDDGGRDHFHVQACRAALDAYINSLNFNQHLPHLADDLRKLLVECRLARPIG